MRIFSSESQVGQDHEVEKGKKKNHHYHSQTLWWKKKKRKDQQLSVKGWIMRIQHYEKNKRVKKIMKRQAIHSLIQKMTGATVIP